MAFDVGCGGYVPEKRQERVAASCLCSAATTPCPKQHISPIYSVTHASLVLGETRSAGPRPEMCSWGLLHGASSASRGLPLSKAMLFGLFADGGRGPLAWRDRLEMTFSSLTLQVCLQEHRHTSGR